MKSERTRITCKVLTHHTPIFESEMCRHGFKPAAMMRHILAEWLDCHPNAITKEVVRSLACTPESKRAYSVTVDVTPEQFKRLELQFRPYNILRADALALIVANYCERHLPDSAPQHDLFTQFPLACSQTEP